MRVLIKWLIVLLVLGAAGALAYPYARAYWRSHSTPKYRTAEVVRGEIVSVVNATGTMQPVLSIRVGSFVSGVVIKVCGEYNATVHKNDLLAEIDPRIYAAIKDRDEAVLATTEAEVERVKALLQQAENDYQRALALRKENPDYLSDSEVDRHKFNAQAFKAQVKLAEASVLRAKADLKNSQANLGYARIVSPVDGTVIDRKVEEGQTLAAQFQVPDMFVVAPDLTKEMHVYASVDEADIGLIREAKRREQPVFFTVDAYPEDLFEGRIYQIRMNPTTKENVVTYNVVVSAANPDLKLLPGMTAKLSFHIEKREDVLKIPTAALRFYPKTQYVRPEDRKLLEGSEEEAGSDDTEGTTDSRSAIQRIQDRRKQNRRHVWMVEGEFLRAVEVVTGLSDYKHTELVSGDLEKGQQLVTGLK